MENFHHINNEYQLDELCRISPKKYDPNKDTINYKCIELEHIEQNIGTINGFTWSKNQQSIKNKFNASNVLFGKLRPYLKKFYNPNFEGVCSSEIWVLEPTNIIKKDYLFYLIQSNKFITAANISCGSKMPRADWDYMKEISFSIPDFTIQTKIATFLNLYYKKIELLNKKLNLLKLRKEGFLQRVFRKQYPNIYKLNAILKERSTYSSDKQMYTHATLSKDGVFPKTERYNRDFLVKDEEKKYKITYKNDICYNPANLKFGVICLNNYGTLIFSPIYVTFEININLTDVTYISHLLTWNETIQKLRKYEEGTVYERMAVSSEDFVKLIITLPAIQEQKNISQKILSFDKEIDLISNKINLLEKYKQGLLQKLFI